MTTATTEEVRRPPFGYIKDVPVHRSWKDFPWGQSLWVWTLEQTEYRWKKATFEDMLDDRVRARVSYSGKVVEVPCHSHDIWLRTCE